MQYSKKQFQNHQLVRMKILQLKKKCEDSFFLRRLKFEDVLCLGISYQEAVVTFFQPRKSICVVGSHSCLSVRLFTSGYGLTVFRRPRHSPPVINHRWTSMSSSVITLNHPSSLFHRSLQLSSLKKKHALLKYRFLFEE